jgi:hypothetical protein
MKKLALTNSEISHLREIYEAELEKTQMHLEHLVSVLKKINSSADLSAEEVVEKKSLKSNKTQSEQNLKLVIEKPSKQTKKVIVKQTEQKDAPKIIKGVEKEKLPLIKSPGKRGRKPKGVSVPLKKGVGKNKVKWNDFVINTLTKLNTPSLSSQITAEAVSKFKTPQSDLSRVRLVISGALSKLVNSEKKLLTQRVPGSREKLYGLREWFNEQGELLPEYTRTTVK